MLLGFDLEADNELRGYSAVVLVPLSPYLPLYNVAFTSAMRGLYTARVLHRPYFEAKKMSSKEVETWLQERRWGYRGRFHCARLSTDVSTSLMLNRPVALCSLWICGLPARIHPHPGSRVLRLQPDRGCHVGV